MVVCVVVVVVGGGGCVCVHVCVCVCTRACARTKHADTCACNNNYVLPNYHHLHFQSTVLVCHTCFQ